MRAFGASAGLGEEEGGVALLFTENGGSKSVGKEDWKGKEPGVNATDGGRDTALKELELFHLDFFHAPSAMAFFICACTYMCRQ